MSEPFGSYSENSNLKELEFQWENRQVCLKNLHKCAIEKSASVRKMSVLTG
jgi:hypothetical protein